MSDYLVTDTELTAIANAIRTKGGTSASLSFPTEFVSAINAISGGGGGGGLEYEEGIYAPSADINSGVSFSFTNTHSTAPALAMVMDITGDTNVTDDDFTCSLSLNYVRLFGVKLPSSTYLFVEVAMIWRNNFNPSGYKSYSIGLTNTSYTPYNNTLYFRAGRTYKWIAIWK